MTRYAAGWWSVAGACPKLHIIIGVNNVYLCPHGGSCAPYYAGQEWGMVVYNVQTFLRANYGTRITAWGGDDIEEQSTGGWDCATKTRAFVNGFNATNPSGAEFIDYGTATAPVANCWSTNLWC